VVLVAGCATLEPADYQKAVERRATERWQALIKGDLDRAYSYLSPGTRETMTADFYKRTMRPGMWRSVKVDSVSCDGNVCVAQVDVTYDHRRAKGVTSRQIENWLIQDGNAWYVLRK
jgi:hypothetical protein